MQFGTADAWLMSKSSRGVEGVADLCWHVEMDDQHVGASPVFMLRIKPASLLAMPS